MARPEPNWRHEGGYPSEHAEQEASDDSPYLPTDTTPDAIDITVSLSSLLELDREEQQRYILQQAAVAIDVPYPVLQDLSDHYRYVHDRTRQSVRRRTLPEDSHPPGVGAGFPSMQEPDRLRSEDYERPPWNDPHRQGHVRELSGQESYSMFSSDQSQVHPATTTHSFEVTRGASPSGLAHTAPMPYADQTYADQTYSDQTYADQAYATSSLTSYSSPETTQGRILGEVDYYYTTSTAGSNSRLDDNGYMRR